MTVEEEGPRVGVCQQVTITRQKMGTVVMHTLHSHTYNAHIFLRRQKNEALQQDPWEQVSRVGRIPNDAEVVSNLEGRPS